MNLGELLQNPMVQQMTQQMMQNPQLMENLVRSFPLFSLSRCRMSCCFSCVRGVRVCMKERGLRGDE